MKRKEFDRVVNESMSHFAESSGKSGGYSLIGHSRLVTNGSELVEKNNQPVIGERTVCVHNGIITNIDQLWEKSDSSPTLEVDSEIIPHYLESEAYGLDPSARLSAFAGEMQGTFSIACLFGGAETMLLATNCGSLYFLHDKESGIFVFASEFLILEEFLKKSSIKDFGGLPLGADSIQKLESNHWLTCGLSDGELKTGVIGKDSFTLDNAGSAAIEEVSLEGAVLPSAFSVKLPDLDFPAIQSSLLKRFSETEKKVASLKRCTRCILPSSFPFIRFDDAGVCNFCNHYQKINPLGFDALKEKLGSREGGGGQADGIMTFSGGRDSCYGLHVFTQELGMRPVAYTYDWGMITDLGRRNQARMCGKLGVEHIVISADIRRKRSNIRKNVAAWLKTPDLGTVPLFMAGDKQYFYYANWLAKKFNADLVVLCENMLETTNFKTGFCGIAPAFEQDHTYSLSKSAKMQMIMHYAKNFLRNPSYINSSVWDSMHAFMSYYMISHDYLNMFDYLVWDEQQIEKVLLEEYDWEIAEDTTTTWRIGDGTAAFYNYIYYVLAGFTEHETFRSNQIREGMISREEALASVAAENTVRFESMRWYCETVGLNFADVVDAIHRTQPVEGLR
ncbi:hypothetical protein VSU19_21580 [Verrucomicrobiales bacterium BCK34]|nr:hypothetical protein [Verrucomicrobiales bacterium BCK34]